MACPFKRRKLCSTKGIMMEVKVVKVVLSHRSDQDQSGIAEWG